MIPTSGYLYHVIRDLDTLIVENPLAPIVNYQMRDNVHITVLWLNKTVHENIPLYWVGPHKINEIYIFSISNSNDWVTYSKRRKYIRHFVGYLVGGYMIPISISGTNPVPIIFKHRNQIQRSSRFNIARWREIVYKLWFRINQFISKWTDFYEDGKF